MNRILIDMSPVLYSSLISEDSAAVRRGLKPDPETNKNPFSYKSEVLYRVLEEIVNFKQSFKADEVILSFDNAKNGGYWRKLEYGRIKYGRSKGRDESRIDWGAAFEVFETIKEILKTSSSMKVIDVPHAEADDHAFTLSKYLQDKGGITLISLDGDWEHALNYKNVKLFKTRKTQKLPGIYIELSEEELKAKEEQVSVAGDPKDGLLHVKSWTQFSDEFLMEYPKLRGKEIDVYDKHHEIEKMFNDKHDWAKSAYKHPRFGIKSWKKKNQSLDDLLKENPIHKWNYELNRKMCLPEMIPDEIRDGIIEEYNQAADKRDAKALQKFFAENHLFELTAKLPFF
jgi:hypothetical protein